MLVTDAGEEVLRAGDAPASRPRTATGTMLQNRPGQDAVVLEIGRRVATSAAHYSDIDMVATPGGAYTHRDGRPTRKRNAADRQAGVARPERQAGARFAREAGANRQHAYQLIVSAPLCMSKPLSRLRKLMPSTDFLRLSITAAGTSSISSWSRRISRTA